MSVVFVPKDIIDKEDVVAVFIVEPIILDTFARLCENSPRVPGRFVFESWITDSIG